MAEIDLFVQSTFNPHLSIDLKTIFYDISLDRLQNLINAGHSHEIITFVTFLNQLKVVFNELFFWL